MNRGVKTARAISLPEADWANWTPRKMGSPPSVPVWITLVTRVLVKISKFDLESAGERYDTEALLLWPPPIENWVQPGKSLIHIRRMYVTH